MIEVWRPIRDDILSSTSYHPYRRLSADDIISIVRERIEPSRRRVEANGRWTAMEPIHDSVVSYMD